MCMLRGNDSLFSVFIVSFINLYQTFSLNFAEINLCFRMSRLLNDFLYTGIYIVVYVYC